MVTYVVSRKVAFRVSWEIFKMATGTSRVGIRITEDELVLMGSKLLETEGL